MASLRRFLGFCAAECLSVFSLICCAYAIAPEQKARATYENLIKLIDDPDVIEPLKFLRTREIVHYQRFGEILNDVQMKMASKNKFYFNKK